MKREQRAERERRIRDMLEQGMSGAQIAADLGLTRQRVNQILDPAHRQKRKQVEARAAAKPPESDRGVAMDAVLSILGVLPARQRCALLLDCLAVARAQWLAEREPV